MKVRWHLSFMWLHGVSAAGVLLLSLLSTWGWFDAAQIVFNTVMAVMHWRIAREEARAVLRRMASR